jgi:hypothetical protein
MHFNLEILEFKRSSDLSVNSDVVGGGDDINNDAEVLETMSVLPI